jgi:N-acetylglucosamine-6-sulfatase
MVAQKTNGRRRRGHRLLIGLAAAALALPASAAGRPNVVVVMTDDQRADTVGYMPNVLGLDGTVYERAYAVQPLCCPSRASFLTGQYPHAHLIRTNTPDPERVHELEAAALPVWLDAAGYHTGYAGKYLNGYPYGGPYVPPAWDEWYAMLGDGDPATNTTFTDGETVEQRPEHEIAVIEEFGLDFIADHAGDDPFFLVLAPLAPHAQAAGRQGEPPLPSPMPRDVGSFAGAIAPGQEARVEEMSDKAAFLRKFPAYEQQRADLHWQRELEAIQGVDRMVAAVRAELEARAEWDETVLILTSDNGFMLGEHRLWAKDVPYEESARVPLVVAGPGFEDSTTRRVVANVDLPRTIAKLAGADPALPQDGRALLAKPRKRLLVTGLGRTGGRPVRRGWRALVTRRWSFVNWAGYGGRELYDLRNDPAQLEAIPGAPAFKRELQRWIRLLTNR